MKLNLLALVLTMRDNAFQAAGNLGPTFKKMPRKIRKRTLEDEEEDDDVQEQTIRSIEDKIMTNTVLSTTSVSPQRAKESSDDGQQERSVLREPLDNPITVPGSVAVTQVSPANNAIIDDTKTSGLVFSSTTNFLTSIQLKPSTDTPADDEDDDALLFSEAPPSDTLTTAIVSEASQPVIGNVDAQNSMSIVDLLAGQEAPLRINNCVGSVVKQLVSRGSLKLRTSSSSVTSSPHIKGTVPSRATLTEHLDTELVYKDKYGRVLTDPKEQYRVLSHKFHGKAPGKAKTDKLLKRMLVEKKKLETS